MLEFEIKNYYNCYLTDYRISKGSFIYQKFNIKSVSYLILYIL